MTFQPAPLSASDLQIIESNTWGKLTVAHVKAFVSAWNAGIGLEVLTQAIPAKQGHLAKLIGVLRGLGVEVRTKSKKPGGRKKGFNSTVLTDHQQRVLDEVTSQLGPDGTGKISGVAISERLGFKHSSGAAVILKALVAKGRLVKHWSVVGVGACYGLPGSVSPPKPAPARAHTQTPPEFAWTDAKVKQAHALYAVDGLSGAQAARIIGCSRSAMIAKAHRMGWADTRDGNLPALNLRRNTPPRQKAEPKPKPVRPEVPKAEAGKFRCIPLTREPQPLLELEKCQCRYPVSGDGEATLFCGVLAEEGQPYCPGHAAICFNGIPQNRLSKPYDPTVRSARSYAA